MRKVIGLVGVIAFGFFLVGFSFMKASAQTGSEPSALAEVRKTIDEVVAVAESLAGAANTASRRAKLRQVIEVQFDFPEMSRRCLGTYWSEVTPDQQSSFVSLFSDLLAKTYISRIETVTKDTVSIEGEDLRYPKSVVKTKVKTGGDAFPIQYKLQSQNGQWKVYDVQIENIGLVANYRNEFSAIIRSDGFDGLLKKLKEKLAK